MHTLVLKSDNPNTSYRLSKLAAKTLNFGKNPQGYSLRFFPISMDFNSSQNSNLNPSLERPSQELLNAYLIFVITQVIMGF